MSTPISNEFKDEMKNLANSIRNFRTKIRNICSFLDKNRDASNGVDDRGRKDDSIHYRNQIENSQEQKMPQSFSLIMNFESQIVELQSLLIWENPRNSFLALIGFSCAYWIIVLWQPRLLFVVASIGFCYHFYEMWHKHVWPEIRIPSLANHENWTAINPKVLSVPEIKLYFEQMTFLAQEILNKMIEFRKRSHGTFCCCSLIFFVTFYYIGLIVPGIVVTYFIVISILLTPGFLIHVLPRSTFESLIKKLNLNRNDDDFIANPMQPSSSSSSLSSNDHINHLQAG
ncbi:Low affinity cationic amino acid transporter 2 [Sarcoptes scabiei]|nr:Low affinity cationic amino acid transporter 2 [Sarcoptes scabiei]